jgi:hypothetical protein
VPLEHRPELPVREQLLVRDRAGGAEHRVQQRRRVPLREHEPVVGRRVRRVEFVPKVLGHEHGHQVGGRHPRRRMARLRRGSAPHRIDPELLAELTPELDVVHRLVT